MAQPYLQAINELMALLGQTGNSELECKHFFSGAACYASGKIFASLTPAGFALKLPESCRSHLMTRNGRSLRYFPGSPVKREYVVLPPEIVGDTPELARLVGQSQDYALASR